MPSQRLLTMGLLSKHPSKSSVLKRFTAPPGPYTRRYTDYEKMHMVALWYTPGLSKTWIFEQFAKYGLSQKAVMDRMMRIVHDKKNRAKWEHLGQRNILFIGQPEVERYFARSENPRLKVPNWALPILNDEIKRGLTQTDVAHKYGLSRLTVRRCLNRSMFEPRRNEGLLPWKPKG